MAILIGFADGNTFEYLSESSVQCPKTIIRCS